MLTFILGHQSRGCNFNVNTELAEQYFSVLKELESKLDHKNFSNNFDPLRANGVITFGVNLPEPEDAWALMKGRCLKRLEIW